MDNLTRIVKTEISRQYKSVRQFAFAAVVVQLGILIQQLLGVLRQIEGGIAGDGLDPQRLADLHHRVEGRTSDAVVQRTVDGR